MSLATAAAVRSLRSNGIMLNELQFNSAAVSTQTAATAIVGQAVRVTATAPTVATANSSGMLKSLLSGEAGDGPVFVINNSGATIKVFCAVGEKMDGSTNGSRTIADGSVGVFLPVFNDDNSGTADWRSNTIA